LSSASDFLLLISNFQKNLWKKNSHLLDFSVLHYIYMDTKIPSHTHPALTHWNVLITGESTEDSHPY